MSAPSYGPDPYSQADPADPYPRGRVFAPPAYGQDVFRPRPKSKRVAVALLLLLGGLGCHNFYLGQVGRAIGHIVLSLLGAMFLFGTLGIMGWASLQDQDQLAIESVGLALILSGGAGVLLAMANGIWFIVEFIVILFDRQLR